MTHPGAAIDFRLKIVAGLLLAAWIAWSAPYDRMFDAATFGVPALRAIAIVLLALVGAAVGRRVGMGVAPIDLKRPSLAPVLVAAAIAVGCALVEALMPASVAPRVHAVTASYPLLLRIVGFMMRAFNENILYRLFLGSIFVWLVGLVWKGGEGRPAAGAYWTGFVASQAVNIWVNMTALAPVTPLAVLHDALRYVGPGVVYGWLYWKHGFQSNEIACTSVHVFLQPLLSLGIA